MAKKTEIVVQSNKLIEARYTLTTSEQRLVLAMVSKINKDDDDLKSYEITFKELSNLMNIDLENIHHEIKKITIRLMQRLIYIKDDSGLVITHWVSYCRHDKKNKVISLRFDPCLKPYLLKLKSQFTIINLNIVTQFQSMYSVRIYQLLSQYKNIGYRFIEVDEFRDMIGLTEKQYKEFKDLRKWIINQAKKEFDDKNNKCDLTFDLETIKEGRKIVRLKFVIHRISAVKAQLEPPAPAQPTKKHPPLSVEMQEFEQWLKENDAFMYGFMQEYGPNALMVQAEYRKFLERREEALQG